GGASKTKFTPAEVAAGACNKQNQGSGTTTTCTGTEEYSSCLETKCQAQYEACLGKGYKSGDYTGGICETYLKCTSAAADTCNSGCMQDSNCTSCFSSMIGQCALSAGCTLPMCTTSTAGTSGGGSGTGGGAGTGGSGGKTCADLDACCATLDSTKKPQCEQAASSVKAGGDGPCGQVYTIFCGAGG
ncbi:MAG TPA: hypothetical protein VHM19_18890, partial [Polyangiales bacterium]|nr:hypothetical protein [Polyangiales bacterium]